MSKMSAQHTPGPWMAAAINSPRIAFVVTPKPRAIGGSRITGTVATVPSHEAADESAANARLIAAAPDTAEKAMAFTLLVERFLRDDTGQPGVSETELSAAMYELRSHIAAARGQA